MIAERSQISIPMLIANLSDPEVGLFNERTDVTVVSIA